MDCHIFPDQMQADTATQFFIRLLTHLIETIENIRKIRFGNSDSCIGDFNLNIHSLFDLFCRKEQIYRTTFRGKFKGIGQQIIHNLMHFVAIKKHIDRSMQSLIDKVKMIFDCHRCKIVAGRDYKFLHIPIHQVQPLSFHFQFPEIK